MKFPLLAFVLFVSTVSASAQTLPGPPFTCQTTCTAASTATGTLPATPFTCQNVCTVNPSFATPTLPENAITCAPTCTATATPAVIPATPFTCQQVCSAPYTPVVGPPPGSPVVTPASFTMTLPITADQLVHQVTISNLPLTAMAIISGDLGNPTLNPPGYFAVWPTSQNLRTSETLGAVLPPAGTYNLMIDATNASGTGAPVLITVIVP